MTDYGIVPLFRAGGWVMYPLLGLSVLAVTLCFERVWFWLRHRSRACTRYERSIIALARTGNWSQARKLSDAGPSVPVILTRQLLAVDDSQAISPPMILEADVMTEVESIREPLERFSGVLSVTITAAPMLGILGTVTGIIHSFRLLGTEGPITDPVAVAGGISEALLTTAMGLGIAILILFPYTVFRAKADRALGQLEAYGHVLGELSRETRSRTAARASMPTHTHEVAPHAPAT